MIELALAPLSQPLPHPLPLLLRDDSGTQSLRHSEAETRSYIEQAISRGAHFAVVLHDDPVNGFDYVVRVIRKVFGYGTARACWLTLKAHRGGQSELWRGSRQEALRRADGMIAMGPDPLMRRSGATALHVSVEAVGEEDSAG